MHSTVLISFLKVFVLDLAPNGDLKETVLKNGPLSLECARFYTAQMVDAILFMHEAGVAHRDIKPENCLLDESMRIKIADFGSAYVNPDLKTARTSTFVGTAMFIAPEVLSRSKCDPKGFVLPTVIYSSWGSRHAGPTYGPLVPAYTFISLESTLSRQPLTTSSWRGSKSSIILYLKVVILTPQT